MNSPLSAHFEQREATGLLLWELNITDAEELKLLDDLLNSDDLSPLKKGQSKWADGGAPIAFEMCYTDFTIGHLLVGVTFTCINHLHLR